MQEKLQINNEIIINRDCFDEVLKKQFDVITNRDPIVLKILFPEHANNPDKILELKKILILFLYGMQYMMNQKNRLFNNLNIEFTYPNLYEIADWTVTNKLLILPCFQKEKKMILIPKTWIYELLDGFDINYVEYTNKSKTKSYKHKVSIEVIVTAIEETCHFLQYVRNPEDFSKEKYDPNMGIGYSEQPLEAEAATYYEEFLKKNANKSVKIEI